MYWDPEENGKAWITGKVAVTDTIYIVAHLHCIATLLDAFSLSLILR